MAAVRDENYPRKAVAVCQFPGHVYMAAVDGVERAAEQRHAGGAGVVLGRGEEPEKMFLQGFFRDCAFDLQSFVALPEVFYAVTLPPFAERQAWLNNARRFMERHHARVQAVTFRLVAAYLYGRKSPS